MCNQVILRCFTLDSIVRAAYPLAADLPALTCPRTSLLTTFIAQDYVSQFQIDGSTEASAVAIWGLEPRGRDLYQAPHHHHDGGRPGKSYVIVIAYKATVLESV